MESINNTPVLILRQNNKSFKARQKQLDRRVRNKKHLQEYIYSNHNIFQSNINLYRNMTAQNLIWDKNYNYKCLINQANEENSGLKARIWNVEKENRRMERQIQAWNLSDYSHPSCSSKKPYIDMATVEKVICDQDYTIVSMKMHIFQLQKLLQERDSQFTQLQERARDSKKLLRLLNHEIALKKIEVCECIEGEGGLQTQFQKESKEKMSQKLMRQNQQLDLISKNLQIKKKSKQAIQNELTSLTAQCQLHKEVTYEQIQRLAEQTRRMKAEQDGGINLQKQKLRLTQKGTLQFECYMQSSMDQFIKNKVPIQIEVNQLLQKLSECQVKRNKVLSFW